MMFDLISCTGITFQDSIPSFENSLELDQLVSDQDPHWIFTNILNPYGPRHEKTCLRRFANNKGADQPAHPLSLISAFVIHCLESTISKLTTSEISTF